MKTEATIKKLSNLKKSIDFRNRSEEYHIGFMDGIGAALDYLEEENDKD